MPQFRITLTDEQAEALRQLADHWRESLDDALARVVSEGIDSLLSDKENDERHDEDMRRAIGPGGMDDDIPF
jgi:DNA-binding MarR family transcriptional regulator